MVVGEDGGEVEPRSHSPRGQDWRRRVRGLGVRVVWHANRRAQVALVGSDAGVDGWRDEGGRFGKRDDEGLGASPPLELGLSVVVQSLIVLFTLGEIRYISHH